MRIIIATDDWGRISGVVRSYEETVSELTRTNCEVTIIHPGLFKKIANGPQEVPVVAVNPRQISRIIGHCEPDRIHVATEGPIGFFVWRYCRSKRLKYSTAYHTNWASFFSGNLKRALQPADKIFCSLSGYAASAMDWTSWKYLNQFHGSASSVMTRPAMVGVLQTRGFDQVREWRPGVDTQLFTPEHSKTRELGILNLVYIGRISPEKDIDRLFRLDLQRILALLKSHQLTEHYCDVKLTIVGNGPLVEAARTKFPHIRFPGAFVGEELAKKYSSSDIFINPSSWETFGRTVLEGLASGLSVVTVPGGGPELVLKNCERCVGIVTSDLEQGVADVALAREADKIKAIQLSRSLAGLYSLNESAKQFLDNTVPVH